MKKYTFPLAFFLLAFSLSWAADTARVTVAAGLRLRNSPDLKAEKMGVIPHGTLVTVLEVRDPDLTIAGVKGRWTKVRWDGAEGWVFGGFLEKTSQRAGTAKLPAGFPKKWVSLMEKNGRLVVPVWCFAETPHILFREENGVLIMEFNMGQESLVYEVAVISPIINGYAFEVKETGDGHARTILFKRHPSLPGRCTWENIGGAWDDEPFVGGDAVKKYPVYRENDGKCPRP